jgi:hypothetical protein
MPCLLALALQPPECQTPPLIDRSLPLASPLLMADAMDYFTGEYEFLALHMPASFEPFSTGATNMDQLDDYLCVIDALPPRPPTDVVRTPSCNNYTTAPLCGAVDYDTNLP